MRFSSKGLTPVRFPYKEITDCESVEYLGQKAYENNPRLASLAHLGENTALPAFSEVYDSIKPYRHIKEMAFQGAYPDISGFTDATAWNNVTPVLGYHITFTDPLGFSSIDLSVGASPWSNNPWKNRFHAAVEYKLKAWNFHASWNKTDFYDLFGPTRTSRRGYNIGLSYEREYTMQPPFKWHWGASVNAYGDMDALPMYQNVSVGNDVRRSRLPTSVSAHRKHAPHLEALRQNRATIAALVDIRILLMANAFLLLPCLLTKACCCHSCAIPAVGCVWR